MEGNSKPFNIDNTLELNRLELALESAGIGTWELDLHNLQFRWCRRAKKLFSFDGEDVVKLETLLELVDNDFRNAFKKTLLNAKSKESFSLEIKLYAADEDVWVLCRGMAHQHPTNGLPIILGTFVDISHEIKLRDEKLKTSKQSQLFKTIVEQAPMAIGLLKGPELIIELGNEKIFEMWGKTNAIAGVRLADALPEIQGQGFLELLADVYQTGKAHFGNSALVNLERNNRIEQAYFDFVYSPVRDNHGSVNGIMIMATEVTEQFNAIAKLEESELKFRTLIEQMPVGVSLFTGKDMIVELINQPMIEYWGKDSSVIGKPLHKALPELEGQPFLELLADIYENGNTFTSVDAPVDLVVNGVLDRYYFTYTYKPLFDETGKVYAIIDMSIDVTEQVLAKKALQESEARLKSVISSAPAAIGLFVGRELRVEMPNQSFIDIVGKGADIVGKPLSEVMPELHNQPFLQILDDVYTSGVTYQSYGTQVDIVQHGVMSHNFYDITYSPLLDSEGNVYAILDIAIEVTERVNVEKQIHESQLQLLSLFEQSPVGVAMIKKDDLVFTMANPFYCKLIGRNAEDILGKPLLDVLPEMEGQGFDELLKNVINTGIPYHSKEQAVEIAYEDVLQTIYVDLTYQPQRNMDGVIIGVLVVATDLTEQVRSRKRLQQTEVFLRGAIELAELGTYSIDVENGSVECSDRLKHWFGLPDQDQITDQMIYSAVSPDDLPALTEAISQALSPATNGFYDIEYRLNPEKVKTSRILHAQGKVLYDQKHKPVTIIGSVQDVTNQRITELSLEGQIQERTEQLEATNEELAAINEEYMATNEELSELNNLLKQSNVNLQQFAYVASHDLQEPLRKIQSFSTLLVDRYGPQLADGIDYLLRMQSAARRMSELIDDLLAFSRVTSPKNVYGRVSLTKIVSAVLNDLEIAIQESQTELYVTPLPDIQGDNTQLSQLFLNLISNAIKFRKPDVNPVISIESKLVHHYELGPSVRPTRTSNSYYQIDVKDNGVGFEQQYAERIFQLFQRLHGRSEYSGTGIGLAICERVVSNHGGAILAKSSPGEGATFSVFLPL
ncbi:PAS domain-containing sensor histidine kinase [Dyadobacter luteus]|jgi:PAS domain S-box-containing protein|uniref:histidine kinase n=1 Tax=Dyadobacter luteus TaxID=2259619 RepID=A0A3D8YF04_9BACT|nr:PAS domain-containing protein [Dyadobacter luteus]REA62795.1 PAS domain-containing sensor histidine kinase [Dyadobacter luteus]